MRKSCEKETINTSAYCINDSQTFVKLTRLGLPSEMSEYIGDDDNHSCPFMFLWNPEDVGKLSAYDNISLGELTQPSLTTISQPTRSMGQIAASMLIDQIRNGSCEKTKKIFEGELIIRQTTKKSAKMRFV